MSTQNSTLTALSLGIFMSAVIAVFYYFYEFKKKGKRKK